MSSSLLDRVEVLEAGAAGLLDVGLTQASDDELIEAMHRIERSRRQLESAVTHRLIVETAERCIPERKGFTSGQRFLVGVLRVSAGEAAARVRAAADLGPRQSMSGIAAQPRYRHTAAAQADGDIGAEHANRIRSIMHKVPRAIDDDVRDAAEETLATCARTMTPEDVTAIGHRLLAHLNPDGDLTDERDRKRRRSFALRPQDTDLLSRFSGEFDPTTRAMLDPILAKWARPGMNNPDDPDSPSGDAESSETDRDAMVAAAARDTRTTEQRNHDALTALFRAALSGKLLGAHRGLPVTTIVTMTLGQLEKAAGGVATTASGGLLPIKDALTMAQRSHPVLALFDHNGRPLHLGRRRRLADADQRLALIAADRGCTRPGCSAPATYTAVHHAALDYAKGGRTDIDTLGLACDGDHAKVNDGPVGWRTRIAPPDSAYPGWVEWIAPKHIDPQQRPRVNHRHHPERLLAHAVARIRLQRENDCARIRQRGRHRHHTAEDP